MLLHYSYHSREKERKINELVGKPFPLIKRLKMKGIGSQKLEVVQASEEIMNLIKSQPSARFCNIELRPAGVIIWLRYKIENYVLVLPFKELKLVSNDNFILLEVDDESILLKPAFNKKWESSFLQKIQGVGQLKIKKGMSTDMP